MCDSAGAGTFRIHIWSHSEYPPKQKGDRNIARGYLRQGDGNIPRRSGIFQMGQAGRGYPRVCPSPLGLTLVISHYHVDWHVAALLIERSILRHRPPVTRF